jgi:hypothetical protein
MVAEQNLYLSFRFQSRHWSITEAKPVKFDTDNRSKPQSQQILGKLFISCV